jgi:hypothetical protein
MVWSLKKRSVCISIIVLGGETMGKKETICPYCEAEIPLEGDEKEGDEIYCSYCQMMLKLASIDGTLEAVAEEE